MPEPTELRTPAKLATDNDDVLHAYDDGTGRTGRGPRKTRSPFPPYVPVAMGEVPPLLIDYIAPSLGTTINAICSASYLFASHREEWRLHGRSAGRRTELVDLFRCQLHISGSHVFFQMRAARCARDGKDHR